ncbi:MAG TPA: hypothetical protein DHU96_26145, partial [Actinobacteria bacterium]|nr:hypothetical protein [Actinomycetota bacterium]
MSGARSGAQFAADVLARAGVGTIFGLPGSTEASLLETLRERAEPRYVLGLHEGAVVSMADGFARVTGRPGVVIGKRGAEVDKLRDELAQLT